MFASNTKKYYHVFNMIITEVKRLTRFWVLIVWVSIFIHNVVWVVNFNSLRLRGCNIDPSSSTCGRRSSRATSSTTDAIWIWSMVCPEPLLLNRLCQISWLALPLFRCAIGWLTLLLCSPGRTVWSFCWYGMSLLWYGMSLLWIDMVNHEWPRS